MNKSKETHNMQQGHTNDPSEDSEAEEMPQVDNIDCLDEDSGTRQEILPLIDILRPAIDPIEEPDIAKATETTTDVETEPVKEEPEIEKATEATHDLEAEPVTSLLDTVFNWISKKKGKTNQQPNSTETTATSTDYKVISDHSPQSFLSINPPRIFTT